MIVLMVACVAARVGFDHKLVPLMFLLAVWLIGGFLSLIQVGDKAKDIQYAGTSIYLGIAAMMFACLFSDGNMRRLRDPAPRLHSRGADRHGGGLYRLFSSACRIPTSSSTMIASAPLSRTRTSTGRS